MNIYVSLPISGQDMERVKKDCKKAVEVITRKGHTAVTPFDDVADNNITYPERIGKNTTNLIKCDAVLFIDRWKNTRECRQDDWVAFAYGKTTYSSLSEIGNDSKQVLSRGQIKHLKELGFDVSCGSVFWHRTVDKTTNKAVLDWYIDFTSLSMPLVLNTKSETLPTFTLQNIIDILPKYISVEGGNYGAYLYIDYQNSRMAYGCIHDCVFSVYHEETIKDNLIDTAYNMLCWCIENGYVETKI